MKTRLLLAALTLAVATPLAAADLSLAKVVVALKPDKNPDAMLAERRTLAAALEKSFGRPVEVIVPLSAAVIAEGLANGTIDLAWVSAMDMLNLRKNDAAHLLLASQINGSTGYKSYWVTLADRPYRDITDLRGKPIAFSSRSSTSGYLIPLSDLKNRGLLDAKADPASFFGPDHVWFGTGYVSAVERVLAGEAEAAAVSDYVLDGDKHLTPEQKSRLRKLQAQGPVPTHVIAASARLQPDDLAALKRGLLALEAADTGVERTVFSAELVEVDPTTHLQPVVDALALVEPAKP